MVAKSSLLYKRMFFLLLAAAAIVVMLDQVTKGIFRVLTVPVIPSVFSFVHTCNSGAVWGILKGQAVLLSWASLAALGLLLYFIDQLRNRTETIGFGMIAGGILGNLIDRIANGCVSDFIAFSFWPSFNIADSCLTIGILLVIFTELREEFFIKNKKQKRKKPKSFQMCQ